MTTKNSGKVRNKQLLWSSEREFLWTCRGRSKLSSSCGPVVRTCRRNYQHTNCCYDSSSPNFKSVFRFFGAWTLWRGSTFLLHRFGLLEGRTPGGNILYSCSYPNRLYFHLTICYGILLLRPRFLRSGRLCSRDSYDWYGCAPALLRPQVRPLGRSGAGAHSSSTGTTAWTLWRGSTTDGS